MTDKATLIIEQLSQETIATVLMPVLPPVGSQVKVKDQVYLVESYITLIKDDGEFYVGMFVIKDTRNHSPNMYCLLRKTAKLFHSQDVW